MYLKLISLAVRYACKEIGLQYRNRKALEAFSNGKTEP